MDTDVSYVTVILNIDCATFINGIFMWTKKPVPKNVASYSKMVNSFLFIHDYYCLWCCGR